MEVKNIILNEIPLSKDIYHQCNKKTYFFITKEQYIKIKCAKILKKRNPWSLLLIWKQIKIDYIFVAKISMMLEKNLRWPNSLFFPDDDLEMIIADYSGIFGFTHFFYDFQKEFGLSLAFPQNEILIGKYVNFINYLYTFVVGCSCPQAVPLPENTEANSQTGEN